MPTAILKTSGDVLATGGLAATLALLVLGLVAMVIAAIALLRARREDIPAVFASFASAFGFRALADAQEPAQDTAADNGLMAAGGSADDTTDEQETLGE